jgi:Putative auto-transporter adhesin, head GIN domain
MRKLLPFFAIIAFVNTSCRFMWGERIRGNGNIKTVERTVSAFKDVSTSGSIHVYITQGPQAPIKIEADENLLDYIEIHQRGDAISIETRDGYNLESTGEIKVYVTAPEFNHIGISGSGTVQSTTKIISKNDLDFSISGSGGLKADLNAPSVDVDITGSGHADIVGETKNLDVQISGSGKARCYNLLSENTTVDVTGSGDADVYASVKLNAQVSGSGNISYKGAATQIKKDITGSGEVNKAD